MSILWKEKNVTNSISISSQRGPTVIVSHRPNKIFSIRTTGASNINDKTNAHMYEMMALPKNIVKTSACWMWTGPFSWNDITICVTGWIKYAQYVSRLSGNIGRYDNKSLIGLAYPHLHDNVIQISAKPQAINIYHRHHYHRLAFGNTHCIILVGCLVGQNDACK